MNFYEHQDRAERRTKYIVGLFILAVFCIVVVVGIPIGFASDWNPVAVASTVVICLLVVGIATTVKLSQLRGGGQIVAEMLGGTAVQRGGSDQKERRVQNVVEEMAIASGMPVPPIYLIEDDGINAFAAGWSSDDAVIGVTRGCIEQLSRDELQGVIAHEFSHISHGDIRINIRLIGVIFGIMVLGITGWILARYVGPMVLRSSSRSRSKEGAGQAGIGVAIILFGLFLALCGAIGTFFGRLIQASVSRQREFLADASAVQYTRNPSGIGGALRKIGGMTPLKHVSSEIGQCNHLFFSQAMKAVFASHPPVTERIARVEGIDLNSISEFEMSQPVAGVAGFSSGTVQEAVVHRVNVGVKHIEKAKEAMQSIGPYLRTALQSGWSARIVMFALVAQESPRSTQEIATLLTDEELVEYRNIASFVERARPITRLPMVDLGAPAIRSLSKEQCDAFHKTLISLVNSDGAVDRFEWVLVSVLRKHTSGTFGESKIKTKRSPLSSYALEISVVLSTLSYCGTNCVNEAELAYKGAIQKLHLDSTMNDVSDCTMNRVNSALKKLRQMKFVDKGLFIGACESCVAHDEQVTVVEAETLRAIGDILDCPIPMFV
jgi:Zn-dependent protease with chaperone function